VSGYRGATRQPGFHARKAAYLDAVGLSPGALEVLLAVMAFERVYRRRPTRAQVMAFLGVTDMHTRELTDGLWLSVEPVTKLLTARPRAWQSLGFERDVRRSA
jgi:hypothetical protein